MHRIRLWAVIGLGLLGGCTSRESLVQVSSNAQARTRIHALCIGVSYTGGPRPLSGTKLDAEEWARLILETDSTAHVLTRTTANETTRDAIDNDLRKWVAETREDDILFLTYSGHGTQWPDFSGDETDDGLDEVFVTSEGNGLIDDELFLHLKMAARRNPRRIYLVVDACHSESIHKFGPEVVAGRTDLVVKREAKTPTQRSDANLENTKEEYDDELTRRLVFIAACRDKESANQTQNGNGPGLLSSTLIKAIREKRTTTTIQEMFDLVHGEVVRESTAGKSLQTPQLTTDDRRFVREAHFFD